jgi:hypothetical protein
MMLSGTEARIRYLTVAFFAQRVLDALVASAEHGDDAGLKPALEPAIQELKTAIGSRPDDYQGGSPRAFSDYEQVRTLDEVCSGADVREVVRALEGLLERRGAANSPEQRRGLEEAITFFSRLESHALRNFDQPIDSLPTGIRELCKAS